MNAHQVRALNDLLFGSNPIGVDAGGTTIEQANCPGLHAFCAGYGVSLSPTPYGVQYDTILRREVLSMFRAWLEAMEAYEKPR